MRKTLALSLLLILTHVAAYAQFGETVEVRVTNIDAIVTDKNGNPVTGLTKADFEVYEDGALQDITHFTEIAHTRNKDGVLAPAPATASPAASGQGELRRRLLTVLVDLGSLEPMNRAAVLPRLEEFLTSNMRPGDATAIYSWGDSLTVELQPTSDRTAIKAAIDRIASYKTERTTFWRQELQFNLERLLYFSQTHVERRPFLHEGIEVTRRVAERGVAEMRQKTEAIKSILAQMRGEDGQKVLVLLTQSLGTNPAEEAFYYFYTLRNQFVDGQTMRPRAEAKRYEGEVRGLATDVAEAANGSGVTLYPLHTAGKFNEITDIESNKGGTMSIKMQPPRLSRTTVSEGDPRLLSLSAASDETGGRAIAGTGNWDNAFKAVSTELNAYYSIGYSAGGERQDRIRDIEVRPKNKAYRVRTRRTLVEQTAATAMKDLVAANLFQARGTNDLAVKAGLGAATAAGENLVHPLTITIPTSTLTLTPDGTDLAGKLLVFVAFLRADGAVSNVGPQVQQFKFPAASLAKRKEVTVKLDVTADAQVGAISLGVLDGVSNATGFALLKLSPTPPVAPTGSTE
jgi:VWFA-related protein